MIRIFIFVASVLTLEASDYSSLLFHGNCTACHHETKAISAPSMKEVKENYINAYSNKNDFIKAMSMWVLKPNAQSSIMTQAIQKYSLMPYLNYQEDALKDISAYIYETEFKE